MDSLTSSIMLMHYMLLSHVIIDERAKWARHY